MCCTYTFFKFVIFLCAEHWGNRSSPQELLTWDEKQSYRRDEIKKFCDVNQVHSGSTVNLTRYRYTLVDDRNKVLYCFVPKVACTSWKTVLISLLNPFLKLESVPKIHNMTFLSSVGLPSLSTMNIPNFSQWLQRYQKFMFVRDPLDRLVSAYRDKFEGEGEPYFTLKYGRDIIRKYRKHPSQQALRTGLGVKFREFVQYILDGYEDLHWISYQKLCNPCEISYDYLGHYESLGEDAVNVLQRLYHLKSEDAENRFPALNAQHNGGEKLTKRYLSQISTQQIQDLITYYKEDFQMFKYDPSKWTDVRFEHVWLIWLD